MTAHREKAGIRTIGMVAATGTLSALVSILFWGTPGTADVEEVWLPWLDSVKRFGLIAGYADIADNYPPGTAALLTIAAKLMPGVDDRIVLKTLCAVAQFLSVVAFALNTKRIAWVLVYLAAVALSGSALGYLDILYAAPLLVALFALFDERPIVSIAAFAAASLIKWQPLIMAPFLAIIWIEQARALPRRIVVIAGVVLLACGTAVIGLFWPEIWLAFCRALGGPPYWSGNALNLPWLAQLVLGYPAQFLFVSDGPRLAARILFCLVYLPILILAATPFAKDTAQRLVLALLGFAAYFLFAPGVHENHLFVPMVASLVLAQRLPRFGWAALALAIFANLNLVIFYGFDGTPPFLAGRPLAVLTAGLAAFALCAFVWVAWHLLRSLYLDQVRHRKRPSSGKSFIG